MINFLLAKFLMTGTKIWKCPGDTKSVSYNKTTFFIFFITLLIKSSNLEFLSTVKLNKLVKQLFLKLPMESLSVSQLFLVLLPAFELIFWSTISFTKDALWKLSTFTNLTSNELSSTSRFKIFCIFKNFFKNVLEHRNRWKFVRKTKLT